MYEINIYCNFNLNFGTEFLYRLTIQKRFENPLIIFNVPQQNDSGDNCQKVFTSKRALFQHIRRKHNKETTFHLRNFVCGHCNQNLSSSFNLIRHIRNIHNLTGNFKCLSCFVVFGCADLLGSHEKQIHLQASRSAIFQRAVSDHNLQASCVQTSINDTFKVFRLNLEPENVELFQFLTSSEESIISFVNEKLPFHRSNRVGITDVKLCKPLEEERVTVYFHSPMERVAHELVQEDFINMIDAIISQLNVYCSGGSGWVVETLKTLEIRIAGPFKGTASSFIETPAELKNVYRSLLNIKNKDEFCFLYSVFAGLFPQKKHVERLSTYSQYMDQLIYKLSDFPMSLSKTPSFENLNNVSISVCRFKQGRLLNVFYSKNRKCRLSKLLLLVDHDKSHYCLIKNFSNLMHHLTRSSSKRVGGPRTRFCGNCMQSIVKHNFSNQVQFCEHHKPLEKNARQ